MDLGFGNSAMQKSKISKKKKNNNNSVFADELFTCHGAVLLCESFWFLQDCVDVSTTVFWLCLMVYNCGITSFDSVNVLYDILAALCYSQWHLFYHLVLDIFYCILYSQCGNFVTDKTEVTDYLMKRGVVSYVYLSKNSNISESFIQISQNGLWPFLVVSCCM